VGLDGGTHTKPSVSTVECGGCAPAMGKQGVWNQAILGKREHASAPTLTHPSHPTLCHMRRAVRYDQSQLESVSALCKVLVCRGEGPRALYLLALICPCCDRQTDLAWPEGWENRREDTGSPWGVGFWGWMRRALCGLCFSRGPQERVSGS
jgi:hypothetical protein